MPRLILMRHAKSSWGDLSLDDFERPLNGRGRASAKAMGDWMRAHGHVPDEVMCSSAERTGETCLRLGFDAPVQYRRDLYHASSEAMLACLREAKGNVVLMIGHNPGIADFAARLVSEAPKHVRFHDYPTCATLIADCCEDWANVERGQFRAIDFAIPREVIEAQKSN